MDLTAVAIVFIAVGLPVLAITLIQLAKIVTGDSRKARASSGDDAQLMQQIHRTLSRLEKRIDSLETIVLDKTNR